MRVNKFIKEVITIVMLAVFTISVTPKKYFHDIFSDHTDELFSQNLTGEKQIKAYELNCGFVNIVAVTPFIKQSATQEFAVVYFQNLNVQRLFCRFEKLSPTQISLRGPPVA